MKTILVIAPQFPSANQPWVDTYLEKLLENGFDVSIVSTNNEIGPYSSKVDRLKLRSKVLPIYLEFSEVLRGAGKGSISLGILGISRAVRTARILAKNFREFVSALLHALYFDGGQVGAVGLIHSHDEMLAYRFLVLAKFREIPLALTFHGLPPSDVQQLSREKRVTLYREVAKVFVNTEFSRQQVLALGCPPQKISVLPQGLCLEDFPFVPRRGPGANDALRILTVGRYHRDKGQAYALIALARLLRSKVDVEWTFVGVGLDLPRLQRLAVRLGVAQNVKFLVELPQDQVKPLYQACHLYVLPSVATETQGVVLQEAQASGCIPIATRVGGVPECVTDGEDAFLVRPRSSRDIVRAVMALRSTQDSWLDIQRAGRRNVEKRFSADVIGERMAVALRTLGDVG